MPPQPIGVTLMSIAGLFIVLAIIFVGDGNEWKPLVRAIFGTVPRWL